MTPEKFTELFNSCLWGAWIVVILAWCFALLSKSIPEKTSVTNQRLRRWQENIAQIKESNDRLKRSAWRLGNRGALLPHPPSPDVLESRDLQGKQGGQDPA